LNSALQLARSALEWRREIQGVADTAWPRTDNPNAPIRRSFKLPLNQSITK